jgi:hypothetical protein
MVYPKRHTLTLYRQHQGATVHDRVTENQVKFENEEDVELPCAGVTAIAAPENNHLRGETAVRHGDDLYNG